ncbi:MAG: lipoate--protein ligase family protein [Dehalococcoidia bacterium]
MESAVAIASTVATRETARRWGALGDTTMQVMVERDAPAGPPWLQTAISWRLLERTSAGVEGETLRLYRPARILAFGPTDRLSDGYEAARAAAREHGFAPLERLAGGRAAVFHEETVAFAWTVPAAQARLGIRARFEQMSELLAEALRSLGVDARVGAVPGEYCPGDYSVNAGGRTKLIGIGQRVLRDAAHVGGVIVVDGASDVRDVLVPVNEALGIDWDPATAGSVRDVAPAVTWDGVVDAVLAAAGVRWPLEPAEVSEALREEARMLEATFADPATLAGAGRSSS